MEGKGRIGAKGCEGRSREDIKEVGYEVGRKEVDDVSCTQGINSSWQVEILRTTCREKEEVRVTAAGYLWRQGTSVRRPCNASGAPRAVNAQATGEILRSPSPSLRGPPNLVRG